jgi:hypothetical protein
MVDGLFALKGLLTLSVEAIKVVKFINRMLNEVPLQLLLVLS